MVFGTSNLVFMVAPVGWFHRRGSWPYPRTSPPALSYEEREATPARHPPQWSPWPAPSRGMAAEGRGAVRQSALS